MRASRDARVRIATCARARAGPARRGAVGLGVQEVGAGEYSAYPAYCSTRYSAYRHRILSVPDIKYSAYPASSTQHTRRRAGYAEPKPSVGRRACWASRTYHYGRAMCERCAMRPRSSARTPTPPLRCWRPGRTPMLAPGLEIVDVHIFHAFNECTLTLRVKSVRIRNRSISRRNRSKRPLQFAPRLEPPPT